MEEFRVERYRSERGLAWMLLAVKFTAGVDYCIRYCGNEFFVGFAKTKQIGVRRALGLSVWMSCVTSWSKIGSLARQALSWGQP